MSACVSGRPPSGGLSFTAFEIGRVFRPGLTRTVTQVNAVLVSSRTRNPQLQHSAGRVGATETAWRRPGAKSLADFVRQAFMHKRPER
jgi:acyl dehydratase